MKSPSRHIALGAFFAALLLLVTYRQSSTPETSSPTQSPPQAKAPDVTPASTPVARSASSPKMASESDERIGRAIQRMRSERAFAEARGKRLYQAAASGMPPAALLSKEEIVSRMDGFSDWMGRYLSADEATRQAMEAEGRELAAKRRPAMIELIQLDPELAIELAVARAARPQLPQSVLTQLETPVSSRSRFDVINTCGFGDPSMADELVREVTIAGESKRVFAYGRRLGVTTKEDLPFHGVHLENVMAMHQSAVRRVDPAELGAAERPVQGEVAVEVGGQVVAMTAEKADLLEAELHRREDQLGPIAAMGMLPDGTLQAPVAKSPHTEGPKTMLAIRIRFSDDPLPGGSPIDDTTMDTNARGYELYWKEVSYGRSTLAVTVTPVLASSLTQANHLASGLGLIVADGEAAARASGLEPDDFDFVTVVTKGGHGYCGVAWVGGRQSHLVCYDVQVGNHEFGHNLGLFHANYNYTDHPTDPTSRDAIAGEPQSPHLEYGHYYSVQAAQFNSRMDERAHYSVREKLRIDWLKDNEYTDARSSGTYRINQLDDMASQGVRGMRVPSGDAARPYFWLNFRTAYTADEWLSNSAQFDWTSDNYTGEGVLLLDMTPQSNDGPHGRGSLSDNNDKLDSGLLIGRTFHEPRSDVYITPIGKGGSRPDEWLDVQVNFGPFPQNSPPEVSVSPQFSDVGVGELVTLTANATDPDLEPVAYDWDFADGSFDPAVLNQPVVSHAFSAPGIYVVNVNVSDMKGGLTVGTAVVRVGAVSGDIVLVNSASVGEGNSGASKVTMKLEMVEPALNAITLDYVTEDGTATAGEDYTATSGAVTIQTGETTQTLEIDILGDLRLEGNENFFVRFTGGGGAILAPSRAPVTIIDDESVDAAPSIDSVTPNKGPVGSEVEIMGSGFAQFKDDNVVYFGSVRAKILSVTGTEKLKVEVPSGATYAPITVSINEFSGSSALPFTVTFDGDTDLGQMAFDSDAQFATGLLPAAVAVGDLDNDGRPELVTANSGDATFSVFRNNSAANSVTLGSFAARKDFDAGAGASEAGVADFDGDGNLDVVIVNAGEGTVSVYRNTSSLGVIGFASRTDLETGSNPSGLAIADVDNNGRFDIVVANRSSSSVSVFPNKGVPGTIDANTFGARVDFIVGTEPAAVAVGDLDGDRLPEIVAANGFDGAGGHSLTILRNHSDSVPQFSKASMTASATLNLVDGARPAEVALADLDGDARLDIVTLDAAGATIWIHANKTAQGMPSEPLSFTGDGSPYSFASGLAALDLAVGDLDGDGWADIAVANDALNQVGILRNKGTGAIALDPRVAVNVEQRPQAIALVDVDQNGKPEIVTAHHGNVVEVNRNAVKIGVKIEWADLPGLTYGEPLGAAQLDAVFKQVDDSPLDADAGTLVYLPPSGTVLDAGDRELKVTFVPKDASKYSGAEMTATVAVAKKTLTVTPRDAQRELNQPNPTFIADYTGFVEGDTEADLDLRPVMETTATQASPVGPYPITVKDPLETQDNEGNTVQVALADSDNNYIVVADMMAMPILSIVAQEPVVTWANPADINYGTLLSETQLNAKAAETVPGWDDPARYVYAPPLGTELLPGDNQQLEVTFTSTDAGYAPKTVTVMIDVNKGVPDIDWAETQEPITFGTPLSEGQLNARAYKPGSNRQIDITEDGTFSYSPGVGTKLSTGVGRKLFATFVPDNQTLYRIVQNHPSSIDILQTEPEITWGDDEARTLPSITFGDALDAGTHLNAEERSRLNGDMEDDIAGAFTYSVSAGAMLDAGEYTITATFTPIDTINVRTVTAERTLVVNKKEPDIEWGEGGSLPNMDYGVALGAMQLNAVAKVDEAVIPGTFKYYDQQGKEVKIGDVLSGGPQSLRAAFTPEDGKNYSTKEGLVLITVDPVDSTIGVNAPDSVVYGTPLSASLLGLTSSPTDGEFVFKDHEGAVLSEEGLVLNVGSHDITVVFNPAAEVSGNFNSAEVVVTVNVVQATPQILWEKPAAITYGDALGGTQLNAQAVVDGTMEAISGVFSYKHDDADAEGKILNAGNSQRLTVMFAPTSPNYKSVEAHVFIDVHKATPAIIWGDEGEKGEDDTHERLADIGYGTALGAAQLTLEVTLNGQTAQNPTLIYSLPEGTVLPAGEHLLHVVYIPADAKNYNLQEATVHLKVDHAALSVTADDKSKAEGVALPELTATYSGFVNGDTPASLDTPAVLSTMATASSDPGDYPINISGATGGNYTITHHPGTLTIVANESPTVSITGPTNGKTVPAMSSVTVTATAADADGSVAKVEFFAGMTSLGVDTEAPFSAVWAHVPIGTHSLTAVATDNHNQSTTSAAVSLTAQAGVNETMVGGEDDTVSVAATGESGVTYALQASSDLKTWTTLKVFVATGGTEMHPDPDPSAYLQAYKFYRIIPVSQLP